MVRRREPVEVTIDNLSHEGRGVGRIDGKTVFVHGALPGERVHAKILRKHPRYDEAEVIDVIESSSERIEARCEYFGVCGGCSMQHVDETFQLRHKQDVLIEVLEHQAGITPERVAHPIQGPQWGYRRKARLGVKSVPKKGGVLVGFRERAKPYVTDCTRCDVLDPRVGEHLLELRALIGDLSIPSDVPQIEVAMGDETGALIVRHLKTLSDQDREALRRFASSTGLAVHTQSGGLDSVVNVSGSEQLLEYRVDDLSIAFAPTEFTQVNASVNEQMVVRALDYLEPGLHDRIVDLFCGIGNFSLPVARRAELVIGVDGEESLVARAASNARANGLANAQFLRADLSRAEEIEALDLTAATKLLLDPPRTGARAVMAAFPLDRISRLVYVSCNPVTFARDASLLVHDRGFRLVETGILDMFPQTAHVESISVFEPR
jgi:23S rRNA (uracil1939-C5)-methyltransferase